MADTSTIANLQAKIWSTQLWVEAQEEIYFKKFLGKMEPTTDKLEITGFNNAIVLKEDLLSEGDQHKGYVITIPIAMKLSGAGVTGDSTLEGNEEAISTYDFSMTVEQLRNAVRDTGLNDNYKVTYNVRQMMKALLKTWLKEKMDYQMFEALSNSPTYSATFKSNRHVYAGDATSVATLDSSTADTGNLFDCRIVKKARRLADKSDPKIRPIIVDGQEYFLILASPEQIRGLHESSDWKSEYRYAWERGPQNPIFTGADSIIDGCIIHKHNNIFTAASGAELANDAASVDNTATAAVARALLLGAQAGAYAIAKRPFWVEKFFDFGNKLGVATGLIYEAAKVKFNSIDYATICIDTMIEEN